MNFLVAHPAQWILLSKSLLLGSEGPSVRKRTLAYCTQCHGSPSGVAREPAEQRPEAEFEIAHLHDAVDGAAADFGLT